MDTTYGDDVIEEGYCAGKEYRWRETIYSKAEAIQTFTFVQRLS